MYVYIALEEGISNMSKRNIIYKLYQMPRSSMKGDCRTVPRRVMCKQDKLSKLVKRGGWYFVR